MKIMRTARFSVLLIFYNCVAFPLSSNNHNLQTTHNITEPLETISHNETTTDNVTSLTMEINDNVNSSSEHYLTVQIRPAHIRPGLLEYEDKTLVDTLEEQVTGETEGAVDLPPDAYEVSFPNWLRDSIEGHATVHRQVEAPRPENNIQSVIRETLQQSPHRIWTHHNRIRHRGGARALSTRNMAAAAAAANRLMSNEPVVNLPVDSLSPDLLSMLRSNTRDNNPTTTASPLSLLTERDHFNMTVDYQAPFQNVEKQKLLEIILLMNSDCTRMPNRIVRWVSGKRGILFDCQNGVWVVKYLMRRRGKPRPVSINDCHEVHTSGMLGDAYSRHQVSIAYSDGERKSYDVLCKHDATHTDHDLIDNHISENPDVLQKEDTGSAAGAWTIIQRRENGGTKFYRPLKKYKRGFGRLEDGEYWLGLEAIHEITHLRRYMLRVEITTGDNLTYFSEYDQIRVASEAKQFRLRLGNYIQPSEADGELSAGDFMSLHNRGSFQTRDAEDFPVNCAKLYGTAFWFRGCWTAVNLNGPYETGERNNSGVRWATANPDEIRRVWKTEMLIKPVL